MNNKDTQHFYHCRKSWWTVLTQEGTESISVLTTKEGRREGEGLGNDEPHVGWKPERAILINTHRDFS